VGMAFSAVAATPAKALGSVLAAGVGAALLAMVLGTVYGLFFGYRWDVYDWLLPLLVATGVFLGASRRRWTSWRMSVLLSLCIVIFITAFVSLAEMVEGLPGYDSIRDVFLMMVGTTGIVGILAAVWFVLGMRTFDAGMAGEHARARSPSS